MPTPAAQPNTVTLSERDKLLESIQDRVQWLSMQMIHHANNLRKNPDGIKVGGHQASSASVVTILTSLFFDYMGPGDRIAIKPHASPVFHAIQYLLGRLDQKQLETLRAFHGLQAYPSRTKDPDPIDFSTGSVGLGAIAPNFGALAEKYLIAHRLGPPAATHRYIAVVGDAELDEGSVWETIVEPHLQGLPNVLWVVDLNRQSLDRVIPGIRVQLWRQMFSANGWRVIDAKYGNRLEAAFAWPKGELLRECIDEMSNQAYQRLLRLPRHDIRDGLLNLSRSPDDLRKHIKRWDDDELWHVLQNLGGHDFTTLRRAFAEADKADRPTVVFAYTLRGWRLPMVGDPQNHSVLLSQKELDDLRKELRVDPGRIWARFGPQTAEGRHCAATSKRLHPPPISQASIEDLVLPPTLGLPYRGVMSTQQAFGLILTDMSRELPDAAKRVVSVSPDVASSTNLGGWINKAGVWTATPTEELPIDETLRALKWEEIPQGQHIELGISESNLFMLLGQLGLAYERFGSLLFPIGTLYDPFVCRGLEAFMYSAYSGARFMVVGTPSGITLSHEGGAHQSFLTPSIGIELPETAFYEPCFAQELEWIVLHGLEQIRNRSESTYLRLTTRRIDQGLLQVPDDPTARELLRQRVLEGAYRLVSYAGEPDYRPGGNVVHIFASGPLVEEAVEASRRLKQEGVFAPVVNVTSADLLFRRAQAAATGSAATPFMADILSPQERRAPVVTVFDGHPHTLAWIGGALGSRVFPLGVSKFGQSGTRDELYAEYLVDVPSIMSACFEALEDRS